MALTTYIVVSVDKPERVIGYGTTTTFPPIGTKVANGKERHVVGDVEVVIKDGQVDTVNVYLV